jgi:hypothetical protein
MLHAPFSPYFSSQTLRENPPEAARRNYTPPATISTQASFSFLQKE